MKDFETESALYTELLPGLLPQYEGKFAVVKGTRFLGVFDTNDEGYGAGLEAFGVVPFLVREITATPRVIHMLGIRLSEHRAGS